MTPQKILLLILAVYILGFFAHAVLLKQTVYGDGRYYYVWARSIVIDHDIRFTNDFDHFHIGYYRTRVNLPANKYSIGTALLWIAPFQYVHSLLHSDGWGLPYQLAIGLTSVLAALAGLVLLSTVLALPYKQLALTLLLIAGATNLLFYGSLDTVNSHAVSFFIACIVLALENKRPFNNLAFGFFIALLASVRLQDIMFMLLLLPHWKKIRLLPLLLGFTIGFLPQLAAWYRLNGSLANPYLTGGESFDFLHPHILGVLFTPTSGLFLWTPVTAIAVYGLLRNWRIRWHYLTVFLVQLYVVASWSSWTQGASMSGRMFVSALPILAVGLGDIVSALYKNRFNRVSLPLLAVSLCLLNVMGIWYFLATN